MPSSCLTRGAFEASESPADGVEPIKFEEPVKDALKL